MEIFRYFNWIDLLMMGVIIRVFCVGFKTGFIVELFKILTICFSIFMTLHYYSKVSAFLHPSLRFLGDSLELLVFGGLWLLVTVVFKLIRDGLMLVLRVEAHADLEKWGGLILAVVRGAFVCSLLFLMLNVSGNGYVRKTLKASFVRPHVSDLALGVYRGFYDGVIKKFFPNEDLNTEALKLSQVSGGEKPKDPSKSQ